MLKTCSEAFDTALVFDGKKDVYWNIFNLKRKNEIFEKVTSCAGGSGIFPSKEVLRIGNGEDEAIRGF